MPKQSSLITSDQMHHIDAVYAADHAGAWSLMRMAGRCVAEDILRYAYPRQKIAVLVGSGNNGGDGLVAAADLRSAGLDVDVFALKPDKILSSSGDVALAHDMWAGPIANLADFAPTPGAIIVDALFGAGFSGELPDIVQKAATSCQQGDHKIWAVDVPSGMQSDDGQMAPGAFVVWRTVTFGCLKPGHVLYPGRAACGQIKTADIGWRHQDWAEIQPRYRLNHPDLWAASFPSFDWQDHKYTRGMVLVYGGAMAGASQLAARAAAAIGAGYVQLYRSLHTQPASLLPAAIVTCDGGPDRWEALLQDHRLRAVVFGPGCGITSQTERGLFAVLQRRLPCVIDGDAFSLLAGDGALRAMLGPHVVLTPHAGERQKLSHTLGLDSENRLDEIRHLAQKLSVTLVAKGADTMIATPGQPLVIDGQGSSCLASAGTGDVLAGMIGGFLAQGMPPHLAACRAVWGHGRAARVAGPGMIADDLVAAVRNIR